MMSDPRNKEMRAFFDDLGNERGPIDPRAAYCGGRIDALLKDGNFNYRQNGAAEIVR